VPDPNWSCLDIDSEPSTAAGPFKVSLHLVDLVTRQPVSEASVLLCTKLDVNCESPRSSLTSAADGLVEFQVERGFSGFLSASKVGRKSILYFFNPPVDRDLNLSQTLATVETSNALAGQFGTELLADHGTVVISALNCQGQPGQGVSYSTSGGDASTRVFYVVGGLPTTKPSATDATGAGGLINVPVGNVIVSGAVLGHSAPLDTLSVLIRADVTTYTRMVPNAP
jgi:hypothetical protein